MSCSYNIERKGLWLPPMEKAFVEYYGSYALLERLHTPRVALSVCI
jgi:hypothetical protein